jgi:hypothetical protein
MSAVCDHTVLARERLPNIEGVFFGFRATLGALAEHFSTESTNKIIDRLTSLTAAFNELIPYASLPACPPVEIFRRMTKSRSGAGGAKGSRSGKGSFSRSGTVVEDSEAKATLTNRLRTFQSTFKQFRVALPETMGSLMTLGQTLVALRSLLETEAKGNRAAIKSRISAVSQTWNRLVKQLPVLGELEFDLSTDENARERRSSIKVATHCLKILDQIEPDLLAKLSECSSESDGHVPAVIRTKGDWISAVDALELARKYEIDLSLSSLSKLCDKNQSPFRSRKPHRNRREIHLADFVHFLEERARSQQSNKSTEPDGLYERYAEIRNKKDREQGNLN